MECFVCKRDITTIKKASRVSAGGGLGLLAHDACLSALNDTVEEREARAMAEENVKTVVSEWLYTVLPKHVEIGE